MYKINNNLLNYVQTILTLMTLFISSGCSKPDIITLMPTPVIYQDSVVDPFAHLTSEHKNTVTNVFYATNRIPIKSKNDLVYGNGYDSTIHLGQARVSMGDPNSSWDELRVASLSQFNKGELTEPVIISLDEVIEVAMMPTKGKKHTSELSPKQQIYINAINDELAKAVDKEIMLYVHGTKVDFAKSAILTAEIDHFSGRDFVGVAFSWPSHQNIISYMFGTDHQRALDSSEALKQLLIFLSEHTIAERINILSYSAGGVVTSKALFELHQSYLELNADELKTKLKFGTVIFAAADVAVDVFLKRLPYISELTQQVVITITDLDNALIAAKIFMGGEDRIGTSVAEPIEESFIVKHHLSNVEIIDISMGKEVRKFDIVGHHYWYRHPWISSDIMFLMRTDLPAHRRGLSSTDMQGIWFLSEDYPDMVKRAAGIELKGQW